MNVNTGAVYDSLPTALAAGEDAADMVEVRGRPEAVERLAAGVREAARRRRRMAKASRRANRR